VRLAGLDAEPRLAARGPRLPRQVLHERQRRRPIGEFAEEALQGRPLPLDLDDDAAGLVLHEAAEPEARGEAVDEGPEADPLNDAPDHDCAALHDGAPGERKARNEESVVAIRVPKAGAAAP